MKYESLHSQWQPQYIPDHSRFLNAKRQTHQAIQLVSHVGRHMLPAHPWDIFGNTEWNSELGMFLGWTIPGKFDIRAGLKVADLTLHLCTPQGRSFKEFPLNEKTYLQGYDWLKKEIKAFGIDSSPIKAALPYKIPKYEQATGTLFDISDNEAFEDFARTFSNASLILHHVADLHPVWQHIRTWPHHFDISTRRRFMVGDQPAHMGIGFSPGDDHNYEEPYYHLTFSNHDHIDKEALPELPGDLKWHTEKWFGIVLPWRFLVKKGTIKGQLDQALTLVNEGMTALEGVAVH